MSTQRCQLLVNNRLVHVRILNFLFLIANLFLSFFHFLSKASVFVLPLQYSAVFSSCTDWFWSYAQRLALIYRQPYSLDHIKLQELVMDSGISLFSSFSSHLILNQASISTKQILYIWQIHKNRKCHCHVNLTFIWICLYSCFLKKGGTERFSLNFSPDFSITLKKEQGMFSLFNILLYDQFHPLDLVEFL